MRRITGAGFAPALSAGFTLSLSLSLNSEGILYQSPGRGELLECGEHRRFGFFCFEVRRGIAALVAFRKKKPKRRCSPHSKWGLAAVEDEAQDAGADLLRLDLDAVGLLAGGLDGVEQLAHPLQHG